MPLPAAIGIGGSLALRYGLPAAFGAYDYHVRRKSGQTQKQAITGALVTSAVGAAVPGGLSYARGAVGLAPAARVFGATGHIARTGASVLPTSAAVGLASYASDKATGVGLTREQSQAWADRMSDLAQNSNAKPRESEPNTALTGAALGAGLVGTAIAGGKVSDGVRRVIGRPRPTPTPKPDLIVRVPTVRQAAQAVTKPVRAVTQRAISPVRTAGSAGLNQIRNAAAQPAFRPIMNLAGEEVGRGLIRAFTGAANLKSAWGSARRLQNPTVIRRAVQNASQEFSAAGRSFRDAYQVGKAAVTGRPIPTPATPAAPSRADLARQKLGRTLPGSNRVFIAGPSPVPTVAPTVAPTVTAPTATPVVTAPTATPVVTAPTVKAPTAPEGSKTTSARGSGRKRGIDAPGAEEAADRAARRMAAAESTRPKPAPAPPKATPAPPTQSIADKFRGVTGTSTQRSLRGFAAPETVRRVTVDEFVNPNTYQHTRTPPRFVGTGPRPQTTVFTRPDLKPQQMAADVVRDNLGKQIKQNAVMQGVRSNLQNMARMTGNRGLVTTVSGSLQFPDPKNLYQVPSGTYPQMQSVAAQAPTSQPAAAKPQTTTKRVATPLGRGVVAPATPKATDLAQRIRDFWSATGAQPAAKPTAQPVAQPATPTASDLAQKIRDHWAQSAAKPAAEPAAKPVAKPSTLPQSTPQGSRLILPGQARPSASPLVLPGQARPSSATIILPNQARPSASPLVLPGQARPSASPLVLPGQARPSASPLILPRSVGSSPSAPISSGSVNQPARGATRAQISTPKAKADTRTASQIAFDNAKKPPATAKAAASTPKAKADTRTASQIAFDNARNANAKKSPAATAKPATASSGSTITQPTASKSVVPPVDPSVRTVNATVAGRGLSTPTAVAVGNTGARASAAATSTPTNPTLIQKANALINQATSRGVYRSGPRPGGGAPKPPAGKPGVVPGPSGRPQLALPPAGGATATSGLGGRVINVSNALRRAGPVGKVLAAGALATAGLVGLVRIGLPTQNTQYGESKGVGPFADFLGQGINEAGGVTIAKTRNQGSIATAQINAQARARADAAARERSLIRLAGSNPAAYNALRNRAPDGRSYYGPGASTGIPVEAVSTTNRRLADQARMDLERAKAQGTIYTADSNRAAQRFKDEQQTQRQQIITSGQIRIAQGQQITDRYRADRAYQGVNAQANANVRRQQIETAGQVTISGNQEQTKRYQADRNLQGTQYRVRGDIERQRIQTSGQVTIARGAQATDRYKADMQYRTAQGAQATDRYKSDNLYRTAQGAQATDRYKADMQYRTAQGAQATDRYKADTQLRGTQIETAGRSNVARIEAAGKTDVARIESNARTQQVDRESKAKEYGAYQSSFGQIAAAQAAAAVQANKAFIEADPELAAARTEEEIKAIKFRRFLVANAKANRERDQAVFGY